MLAFFDGPHAHAGVAESGWCNCGGVVSFSNLPLQALLCASFVLSDVYALPGKCFLREDPCEILGTRS